MRQVIKLLSYAFLVLWAVALWRGDELPEPAALASALQHEPLQTPTAKTAFKAHAGQVDYSINPLFDYEITGLVVSKHNADTWWDWVHAASNDHLNVADICVVWGTNAASGIYQDIEFSSGQWTCNFSTASSEVFHAFAQDQISNNHLLTDNKQLAKALRKVRVGDQIQLKGHLAEYRHQAGMDFFRGTSTVRTDTGNGACETIFVSDFRVLKPAPTGWRNLRWLAGIGFVCCVLAGLLMPYRLHD